MTALRSILIFGLLSLGVWACHKDEPRHDDASEGGEHAAQKAGADIDEAADEASDEVKHVGNDKDEDVDEASDRVDEATGKD